MSDDYMCGVVAALYGYAIAANIVIWWLEVDNETHPRLFTAFMVGVTLGVAVVAKITGLLFAWL